MASTLRLISRVSSFPVGRNFHKVIWRKLSATSLSQAKIAVVLSGCGVYDGSEIHEASATMVHLSKEKAEVKIFAPDKQQMHVVNHTNGQEMDETRNVLVEAARIARGEIESLDKLTAEGFDAVIFPGGFGAAKNLSSFATSQSSSYDVDQEVERVIREFKSENKPMGFLCISPVLPVKVLDGVEVTVGGDHEDGGKWPYAGTSAVIEELGEHIKKDSVTDIHIDKANKIVSVPAFMGNAPLGEIFDGIGSLVKAVLKLTLKS